MRLVDADVLKARIEQEEDREYDATGYLLHMTDSLLVIDNAPTIDAIPVEWLKKLFEDDGDWNEEEALIDWIIRRWKQEQEGR